MTQQTLAGNRAAHPHPAPTGKRGKSKGRLRRLIAWEWGIVLCLLSGLIITLLAMSHGPDPKHQAADLVEELRAVAASRPIGTPIFGVFPAVLGSGRDMKIVVGKVPPKVCVLASWDLYRLGGISVNNVTPSRVSAAKLVELCNLDETATITWFPNSNSGS